jgi:hypothetical protein
VIFLYIITKTYILKKKKDRKSIKDWLGMLKAQSLTSCGKPMPRPASARESAF